MNMIFQVKLGGRSVEVAELYGRWLLTSRIGDGSSSGFTFTTYETARAEAERIIDVWAAELAVI
mgnify:CR=1 FL=1